MLTGAARAAERMGATHPERVWVVAVPVVVLIVLERICLFAFTTSLMGSTFWPCPSTPASLVAAPGPWSLRTALVITGYAVAGYTLVWSGLALSDYVSRVRRTGRRLDLKGAGGRLLVASLMFLTVSWVLIQLTSVPDRHEVMAEARAGFRTSYWWPFQGAVRHEVPGIRAFCRENLDHPSRPQRLMAAGALHHLGEGDDETAALLGSMTLNEFRAWGYSNLYAHWFRSDPWPKFDGLDGDGGEPWRQYRERFPE